MKPKVSSFLLLLLLFSCSSKEPSTETSTSTTTTTGTGTSAGTSTQTTSGFERLITKSQFEQLFPNRANLNSTYGNSADFYSYQSLVDALTELSKIKIEVVNRQGVTYTYKLKYTNSSSGKTSELIVGTDYNESWNINKPEIVVATINFSDFTNSGVLDNDKTELAGFLANISHETTGGGDAEPTKTMGLWFKEEVGYDSSSTSTAYTDASNTTFPPTSGKSYHGRGPIQLSWNYNYGPASFIMYGDKSVLLNNPEKVLASGKEAFMTAIIFWMMPSGSKPSCHSVINTDRGFGKTINIINGGLECKDSNSSTDHRVSDRRGFYKRYMSVLGLSVTQDDLYLSCQGMTVY